MEHVLHQQSVQTKEAQVVEIAQLGKQTKMKTRQIAKKNNYPSLLLQIWSLLLIHYQYQWFNTFSKLFLHTGKNHPLFAYYRVSYYMTFCPLIFCLWFFHSQIFCLKIFHPLNKGLFSQMNIQYDNLLPKREVEGKTCIIHIL